MKNSELFDLYHWLEAVSHIGWARFAYWVSKNKKRILEEIKTIEAANEPTEWYKEFDKERVELCKKFADKDENWEAKIVGKSYDISDIGAFNKELEKLREKYKSDLEEMEKKNKEYEELLKEETTIDFFKIKNEIIPEVVTAKQLDPIMAVIE